MFTVRFLSITSFPSQTLTAVMKTDLKLPMLRCGLGLKVFVVTSLLVN